MRLRPPRPALALGVLLLAGCGGSHHAAPPGGDPGGKRLRELAHDPVFAAPPAGATNVGRVEKKASYRAPGFTGGGWSGPTVTVTFRSAAAPTDVYRAYAARAESAGWQPGASGSLGLTDRWTKTYPDGAAATLSLSRLGQAPPGEPATYALDGGIAPV